MRVQVETSIWLEQQCWSSTASDVFYIYFLVLWAWPSCGQCWAQLGAVRFIPSTSGHHLPRLSSPGSLCQLLPSLLPPRGALFCLEEHRRAAEMGFFQWGSSSLEAKGITELLCLTPQTSAREQSVSSLTN